MLLSFNSNTLPEPTEEEMKVLMAAVMQNGLMIQQLQLMVALRQKEIGEEENRRQRERDKKEEEEKQTKLKEEEVRTMKTWSWQYVKKFKGYREDKRCKKYSWFGHMAYQCRRGEIEAEREQRGGLQENRWKPLECRVMRYDEEREAAHSIRREVQQMVKCWGCGEVGHCLWMYPMKAARPPKGEAQQGRKEMCRTCKGENHIARNCDTYWRWREQNLREEVKKLRKQRIEELTKKVKEIKEIKERAKGEERIVRRTMRPLRAVWMKVGLEKVDTHKGVMVDVLLDSRAIGLFMNKEFVEKNGFRMEKLERPVKVMNVDGMHNKGEDITLSC